MTQTGTFIAMNDPTLRFTATSLPTRTEVPPNSGVMAAGIGYYPPKTSQSENPDEIMAVPVTVAKSKGDKQPALDAGSEKQHGFMGKLRAQIQIGRKGGRVILGSCICHGENT
jgi:hypothetical protein